MRFEAYIKLKIEGPSLEDAVEAFIEALGRKEDQGAIRDVDVGGSLTEGNFEVGFTFETPEDTAVKNVTAFVRSVVEEAIEAALAHGAETAPAHVINEISLKPELHPHA